MSPTPAGGTTTLIATLLCIILSLHEIYQYTHPHIEHEFNVMKESTLIGKPMQVNLNLTINMKCENIQVHMLDEVGTQSSILSYFDLKPMEVFIVADDLKLNAHDVSDNDNVHEIVEDAKKRMDDSPPEANFIGSSKY